MEYKNVPMDVGMYCRNKFGEIGKIRCIKGGLIFINDNQYYSNDNKNNI